MNGVDDVTEYNHNQRNTYPAKAEGEEGQMVGCIAQHCVKDSGIGREFATDLSLNAYVDYHAIRLLK